MIWRYFKYYFSSGSGAALTIYCFRSPVGYGMKHCKIKWIFEERWKCEHTMDINELRAAQGRIFLPVIPFNLKNKILSWNKYLTLSKVLWVLLVGPQGGIAGWTWQLTVNNDLVLNRADRALRVMTATWCWLLARSELAVLGIKLQPESRLLMLALGFALHIT
jgi:hypothetical protein